MTECERLPFVHERNVRKMDISKLSHGAKLVLGGTVLFLLFSFFNWFTYGPYGESMWHGVGFLAGLLALALIVWEGLRLVNIEVGLPVTPAMVSAFLAILMLLFTFIRFIDKPGGGYASDLIDRSIWAWLGFALSIAIVVGAVMNMQAAGQSFTDVKNTIASGAAAASAAAKSAADSAQSSSGSTESTTAAPAAPAADTASETAEAASDAADDEGDGTPAA